jgi:nicotinate-nucleotide pyrophosphorylase (carboxylating)
MIKHSLLQDRILRQALDEDVGSGDITTETVIHDDSAGEALLLAKERLVVAGLRVFGRVFQILDSRIVVDSRYNEGDLAEAGSVMATVTGPMTIILKGERTALNFFQRMSGIATLTRQFVDKVRNHDVRIVDTRKTAPGLRILDKYAVRVGGGRNHRMGLFDGVLIKDNHITAAGSISDAVKHVRENVPHTLKVEIEVEDLSGLKEAIDAGADVVLLDNMAVDVMREAVRLAAGRVLLEASGNVSLDTVEAIAGTGVDIISVGRLTHSPRAVDVSLKVSACGAE